METNSLTNTQKFLELVKENPNLPIVPFVDGDIGDGGNSSWLASFGLSSVQEYLVSDEQVFIRDDDEIWDVLYAVLPEEEYEQFSDDDAKKAHSELPWIKAIIVDIHSPN